MIEVTQSTVLDFEIKTVWDIVTSLEKLQLAQRPEQTHGYERGRKICRI